MVYGSAEAKQAEAKLKAQSTSEPTQAFTIQSLYDKYIETKQNEVRETSLLKTKGNINRYVLPTLANVKLSKLTVPILQDWKNQISKLSLKTISKKNIYIKSLPPCLISRLEWNL